MSVDYSHHIEHVTKGVMHQFYERSVDRVTELVEASIARGQELDECQQRIVDRVASDFPYVDAIETSFLTGFYGILVERLYNKLDCSTPPPEQVKKDIGQAQDELNTWEKHLKSYMRSFRSSYSSRCKDFQDAHKHVRLSSRGKDDPAERKVNKTEFHWLKVYLIQEFFPQYDNEVRDLLARTHEHCDDISKVDWRNFSPMLFEVFAQQWVDDPSERLIFLDYVNAKEALRDREVNQGGLVRKLRLYEWRRGADTWRPNSEAELIPADNLVLSSTSLPPPVPGKVRSIDELAEDERIAVPVMSPAPQQARKKGQGYKVAVRDERRRAVHSLAVYRANKRQSIRDESIRNIKEQAVRELMHATFNGLQSVEVADHEVNEEVA